jgi:hypothetical protein
MSNKLRVVACTDFRLVDVMGGSSHVSLDGATSSRRRHAHTAMHTLSITVKLNTLVQMMLGEGSRAMKRVVSLQISMRTTLRKEGRWCPRQDL